MEGGKDIMPEETLRYRIKILNLLYEELRSAKYITDREELHRLIDENLIKLEESLKNS